MRRKRRLLRGVMRLRRQRVFCLGLEMLFRQPQGLQWAEIGR